MAPKSKKSKEKSSKVLAIEEWLRKAKSAPDLSMDRTAEFIDVEKDAAKLAESLTDEQVNDMVRELGMDKEKLGGETKDSSHSSSGSSSSEGEGEKAGAGEGSGAAGLSSGEEEELLEIASVIQEELGQTQATEEQHNALTARIGRLEEMARALEEKERSGTSGESGEAEPDLGIPEEVRKYLDDRMNPLVTAMESLKPALQMLYEDIRRRTDQEILLHIEKSISSSVKGIDKNDLKEATENVYKSVQEEYGKTGFQDRDSMSRAVGRLTKEYIFDNLLDEVKPAGQKGGEGSKEKGEGETPPHTEAGEGGSTEEPGGAIKNMPPDQLQDRLQGLGTEDLADLARRMGMEVDVPESNQS